MECLSASSLRDCPSPFAPSLPPPQSPCASELIWSTRRRALSDDVALQEQRNGAQVARLRQSPAPLQSFATIAPGRRAHSAQVQLPGMSRCRRSEKGRRYRWPLRGWMTRSPVARRVALVALLLAQRRQGTSPQRPRTPIVTAICKKSGERCRAATPDNRDRRLSYAGATPLAATLMRSISAHWRALKAAMAISAGLPTHNEDAAFGEPGRRGCQPPGRYRCARHRPGGHWPVRIRDRPVRETVRFVSSLDSQRQGTLRPPSFA